MTPPPTTTDCLASAEPVRREWDDLIRESLPALYAFFGSKPETRNAADDLVQETLIVAWRVHHRYDWEEMGRIIHGIARNRWRTHCRTSVRRSRVLADYERLSKLSSASNRRQVRHQRNVSSSSLDSAIAQLPDKAAVAVRMRYLEQHNVSVLADTLGISETAVSCLLFRSKKQLRRALN